MAVLFEKKEKIAIITINRPEAMNALDGETLAKSLEMIVCADRIDAREALKMGLVSRVVPAKDVMAEAIKTAARICKNAPLAVRAAKEAIYRGMDLPLSEGLRLEQFLAEPIRQTEDAKEGPRAFSEKREPRFKGR